MRFALPHTVPSHVRHFEPPARSGHVRLETDDIAAEQSQTGRVALLAALEQHLFADTNCEQRLGPRRIAHGLLQPRFTQIPHAIGHRALSRKYHARSGIHDRGIRRHLDAFLRRDMLDGLGH